MRLVYAHEMQKIDRWAIEKLGLVGEILMENAGRGVAEVIISRFSFEVQQGVLLLCGPGNNGGDGFVVARHLWQKGYPVMVLVFAPLEKFKAEAQVNLNIIQNIGVPWKYIAKEDISFFYKELEKCGLIVDALFGTGLKRPLEGIYAQVVKSINSSSKPIVAIDMPSGLSADTGDPLGIAVKATVTTTMALPKVGQVIFPGRDYIGELEIIDICIPSSVIKQLAPQREWLTENWAQKHLKKRKRDSHKGTYGHVLIVAGSKGKTGAAILSVLGALRGGAGLVTLVCPQTLNPIFESSLVEAMTYPVSEETEEGSLNFKAWEQILSLAKGKRAAVVGPGIGLNKETKNLTEKIIQELDLPLVIDADALTHLQGNIEKLKDASAPRILTPHPGEMARLLSLDKKEIQKKRLEIARKLALQTGSIVVLKGAATVVISPEGQEAINSSGNPGMATGGMGDVLSGLIASFLAQGYEPFIAACLGVFIHGWAGDFLAKEKGPWGFTAQELAEKIPKIFKILSFRKKMKNGLCI